MKHTESEHLRKRGGKEGKFMEYDIMQGKAAP